MASILFIGGTQFHGPTSKRDKEFCQILGKMLGKIHFNGCKLTLLTGGVGGPPAEITNAFFEFFESNVASCDVATVLHMVPMSFMRDHDRSIKGHFVALGGTMAERRALLVQEKVDCILSIQGGPGTADEMEKAVAHGQRLISFVGSGGASAGGDMGADIAARVISKESLDSPLANKDPRTPADLLARACIELIFKNDPALLADVKKILG